MSIVRVGMSEQKTYGAGYDAIFGAKKKKPAEAKKPPAPAPKPAAPAKKPTAKKGKKA